MQNIKQIKSTVDKSTQNVKLVCCLLYRCIAHFISERRVNFGRKLTAKACFGYHLNVLFQNI